MITYKTVEVEEKNHGMKEVIGNQERRLFQFHI